MTTVQEVTLPGFDGGTDDTDHLVVWVEGDRETVERMVGGTGAVIHGPVEHVPPEDVDFVLPRDAQVFTDRLKEARDHGRPPAP